MKGELVWLRGLALGVEMEGNIFPGRVNVPASISTVGDVSLVCLPWPAFHGTDPVQWHTSPVETSGPQPTAIQSSGRPAKHSGTTTSVQQVAGTIRLGAQRDVVEVVNPFVLVDSPSA
jgi:hypothetical protein